MRRRAPAARRAGAALAVWLAVGLPARPAWPHDIYIGYGQAEVRDQVLAGQLAYNRLDLLQALASLRGGPVETVSPEEFDGLLRQYIEAHFQAATAAGALPLEIVERTQNADNVFLRFRCPSAAPLTSLRLRNDVLFELFPQQVNTLTLRLATGVSRCVFHPGRPVIEVSLGP